MLIAHILVIGLMLPTLLAAETKAEVSSASSANIDGRWISLEGAELFVPSDLRLESETVDVLVHFHGHPATVEREFLASGLGGVLVTVNRNGLSAVYRAAFEDPHEFGRILADALDRLRDDPSFTPSLRWGSVRVSSFSAGFGAVREILKDDQNFATIDALCMADSIYAGYVDAGDDRRVNPEHMTSWRRFAEAASQGRKTFILTHTDLVPGTYASTGETADDLIAHVGAERLEAGESAHGPFDVQTRAHRNGFQVYGCAGDDGEAHMQHLRSLSTWLSLLAAEATEAGTDADSADRIAAAIEAFEAPWTPEEDGLEGVTIVLHPIASDFTDAGNRLADQLAHWTAAWLYHLVRDSGGHPVLTRPDQHLISPGHGDATDAAVVQRCRHSRADLLLVIDPLSEDDTATSTDALARSLAGELRTQAGVREAGAIALAGATCPAVRLTLPHVRLADSVTLNDEPIHRTHAEAIYKTLVRWIDDHRPELDQRRSERLAEAASGQDDSLFPETRQRKQDRIGLMARSIWTDGTLPLEKAQWFASVFARLSLSDRTIVYYQPQVHRDGDTLIIGGATTIPGLLDTLPEAFQRVGIDRVRNEMRLLPDADHLDGEIYGFCHVPTALTRREPGQTGLPQSQLLFGEPVFVLDRHEGELLIQAGDGYWGWLPEEAIARVNRDQYTRRLQAGQAVLLEDVPQEAMILPRGARLPVASQADHTCALIAPDDGRIEVPAAVVRVAETVRADRARACGALAWLNTPYVFGARSPLGTDCSGFVTNLFEQEGAPIARDAAGQFLSGQLVATSWYRDGIRPGDRLYFINPRGKIYHTAIALTSTHFIHSAPPAVQISSLQPGDRLYSAEYDKAFLGAKRP